MKGQDRDSGDSIENLGSSVSAGSQALVVGTTVINILASGSLAMIWSILNTLQIIYHLNLMRVSTPSNSMVLHSYISNFVNFSSVPY